ncbi:acyltransferase domain-containing protein [Shimazuella sp. AN120528]|uniref:type I polyketide synthase n=1 Tax=Shimazuella soli TaxID=1892854 RepID=UPI001F0EF0D8|nr:type I polyketide synthase [Shimazuella soli]MCH5586567.1 acyltransferase domain-containing protein [Shimazuella soli]
MTKDKLIAWLRNRVAESLYLSSEEIKIDEPLEQYGLGSKESLMISGDLEELLDRELAHTILWDYPTIESLSSYLVGEMTQERIENNRSSTNEPVAVIGMGCRFPGASSAEQFWEMMMKAEDHITTVPEGRWSSLSFEKVPVSYGGFLSHIDQFDPAFFGISPREAEMMDPQQRLLLEVTWEALEDAGLRMDRLKGSDTAVFVGVSGNDYRSIVEKETDFYNLTGNSASILANRISYFMDWYGPSMAIDTACSSSLVAVDLACQSIRSGQSSLAFVGGVNLLLTPSNSIRFAAGDVLAPDGRCKTFDAKADGYVRGEGAGVVVLKSLSEAQADGDVIYAVIHGSSVNQDGKSNGLTAPNIHAQKALLKSAVRAAGVQPEDIFYVEAHGTGTPLGDPIEVRALAEVYAQKRENPLYLGSVKTNIGHLEAAAGIAGLIKSALALHHKYIPPHLHFQHWNPQIPVDQYELEVVTKPINIPKQVYVGVSSFGFGGTNSHVILGEAPAQSIKFCEHPTDLGYKLLAVSAKSKKSLQKQVTQYKNYIENNPSQSLSNLAANAWQTRDQHERRIMLLAKDRKEAIELLTSLEKKQHHDHVFCTKEMRSDQVVFVFSGQGPKWSISQELLEKETVFRDTLLAIESEIANKVSWSLLERIAHLEQDTPLTMVETQVLYFAVQVALAKQWLSWGIVPSAVVGHSLGEVAAAHIAGALTLSEAVDVVIARSYFAQRMVGKGKLLVAQIDQKAARQACEQFHDQVAIAAYNSHTNHVLSGNSSILENIQIELEQKGVFTKFVATSPYPSHSFYMNEIREELKHRLIHIQPKETSISFISTVTGKEIDGNNLYADYWCDNICQAVRFQEAISHLIQDQKKLFLEISPHPILEMPVYECASELHTEIKMVPSLERDRANDVSLLSSLAVLYCNGLSFDWTKVFPDATGRISLPKYPWKWDRYWVDSEVEQGRSIIEKHEQIQELLEIDDYVTNEISKMLKIPVEEIPMNKPIIHLGFDSIMAMRLKSKIEKNWNIQLSIVPILQGCSVEDFIKLLPK